MGLFSKIKGVFYDEVEEEVVEEIPEKKEIKEEKPRVEEIKPLKEEKDNINLDNTFSDRDLFKNERTFTFTELEEDEDLPPRKSVLDMNKQPERPVIREERYERQERVVSEPVKTEAPRVFKPTPIISPIYGILDKDYKREEIKERSTTSVSNDIPSKSTVTSYENIRRKAYGTLEDDLEDTLNKMNKISTTEINSRLEKDDFEDTNEFNDAADTLKELNQKTQKIEELINKIDETTSEIDRTMSIGELEENTELDNFETEEIGTLDDDKTMTSSTLEHDLFNLIDSMYDDKEE